MFLPGIFHKCGKHQQIFYFLAPVHVRSYAGGDNHCSSGIVGSIPTRQRYSCTCLRSPSNRLNHRPSNLTSGWLRIKKENTVQQRRVLNLDKGLSAPKKSSLLVQIFMHILSFKPNMVVTQEDCKMHFMLVL